MPTSDKPSGDDVEARVDALLDAMSLREKIDQLRGFRGLHAVTPLTYTWGPYRTRDNPRLGIPGLSFTDGPRGINLGRSTCFPVAIARGATFDPELEREVGRALGREARAQGANAVGSTCINLVQHPGWGRAQESYGADLFLLGAMGSAAVQGLSENVMPVVKHFACNSIEESRFYVDVRVSDDVLNDHYLRQFERTVTAGAASVMSAYNRVNGEYCGQSASLLQRILKDRWGFDGFVMSDFVLGCRSTARSLMAGLDMEMPQAVYFSPLFIRWAIRCGDLTEARVTDAARRVLRQKVRFGLLDATEPPTRDVVACDAHVVLARTVAERSITLLKNERDVLPLSAPRRLLVVGRLAARENLGAIGSTSVHPPHVVTLLSGIEERFGPEAEVVFAPTEKKALARLQRGPFDAVIAVVGLTSRDEGEYFPFLGGGDRRRLELPAEQERLVSQLADAHERVVVVLMGGSAIACGAWSDRVSAILMAYYPGMDGGRALSRVLAGDVSPSGRLPISFPRKTEDLPPFDPKARRVEYTSRYDYRHHQASGAKGAFPFGHGLTYTSFRYSDLRVPATFDEKTTELEATFALENIGRRMGTEVVQLYVSHPENDVPDRRLRRLAAFRRVTLEPGVKTRVTLSVPRPELSRFDGERGVRVMPAGTCLVEVGGSSADLPLQATVPSLR